MRDEIEVAGLWCSEVLAALGDVLDGEASEALSQAVRAHVAECPRCERFGAAMTALREALRRTESGGLAGDVDGRLQAALALRLRHTQG